MKPKILFVTNKWINGPTSSTGSQYDNIVYTFPQDVSEYEYDILALDESAYIYKKHIDEALISYCTNVEVKAIIIIRLGISELNPSIECLRYLKSIGKYICFFWLDSNPWDIEYQRKNKDLIDLNVSWDNPSFNGAIYKNQDSNQLYLFTPESNLIFKPLDKTIPVSFIGSLRYEKRQEYIEYCKEKIPELLINGGQREQNLSMPKYAEIISNSQMTINFPQHGMKYEQTKGRVFQALASKTLLLENENASTRSILKPGFEYVEFSTKEDLCEKIAYYLKHKDQCEKIALQGYNTYMKKYSSSVFWKTVLDRIN